MSDMCTSAVYLMPDAWGVVRDAHPIRALAPNYAYAHALGGPGSVAQHQLTS